MPNTLRKHAWLSSLRVNFALADVKVPSLFSKTFEYLSSITSNRSLGLEVASEARSDLIEHQFRRVVLANLFPVQHDPYS